MGSLWITGIGPGGPAYMTPQAVAAITRADTLCGYTVYIELVRKALGDRLRKNLTILTTPMRKELERCRLAMEAAAAGSDVAMVCGGDAGIYGMAGPLLAMADDYPDVQIEIIPGLTAAVAGAAVLGAPLMNDFCVISLSDLMTPWQVIEKRLRAAAAGDFCICIYNPMSSRRREHLAKACRILMEEQSPDTPCGWVRNIGRPGQESRLLTLGMLAMEEVDMFTTVFIGNSRTRFRGPYMVTGRGYEDKAQV